MATSTKALQGFLLWCRKEKIVVSSVSLGGLTVTIERDYNLQPPKGTTPPVERKQSLYEQMAGRLASQIQQPAAETANEPTVIDEDD